MPAVPMKIQGVRFSRLPNSTPITIPTNAKTELKEIKEIEEIEEIEEIKEIEKLRLFENTGEAA